MGDGVTEHNVSCHLPSAEETPTNWRNSSMVVLYLLVGGINLNRNNHENKVAMCKIHALVYGYYIML